MTRRPTVTIWNEFQHEKHNEMIGKLYPGGMHAAIAQYLRNEGFTVSTWRYARRDRTISAQRRIYSVYRHIGRARSWIK
jgi:trehalose utilization protein